jgi:glycosyltransferase involved in cell wall biosynthesis
MKVIIGTSDVFKGDAIGNFSLQLREFFESQGFVCCLYARYYNKEEGLYIRDFDLLFDEIESADILFAQYSIFEQGNERYNELSNKKIVYYHGITPPEYFDGYCRQTAKNCAKGLQQYHCFEGFDYYLANSQFMLDELIAGVSRADEVKKTQLVANSLVVPPSLDPFQWKNIVSEPFSGVFSSRNFISVGRLAPHKKIEEVIDFFIAYEKLDKESSLTIVGSDAPPVYGDAVRKKVDDLPESIRVKIIILGHVTQGQLKYLYQKSFALLTLSEHEGFCVPLLEAMYFELPVFARQSSAIPETLGRSNVLLDRQSIEDYVVEVKEIVDSRYLLVKLISSQTEKLKSIINACDGQRLLEIITRLNAS